jgi:hypothetical protein
MRIVSIFIGLVAFMGLLRTPTASAQLPNVTNPSPELVGSLTKGLKITPEQAIGGAGALFGVAKTKLKPEDFLKVANAVPGMDGLLKAAPKPQSNNPLDAIAGSLPGKAGTMASAAGAFKTLGLSPDMVGKFIPVMTKFVGGKGGADVAKLLGGAFK